MDEITKNIVRSKNLGVKVKGKNLFQYYSRKRWAEKSWENRHQKVFELNDHYSEPCDAIIESDHQNKWGAFRSNVDLSTLRICKNISGHADPNIIPEDIFVTDIEPTLLMKESAHFLSHKSFYNRWFRDGIFPKDIFHSINGQYLDFELNPISFNDLKKRARDIQYPLVMKPNTDSFGGKDVFFVKDSDSLVSLCEKRSNFVVQEQIIQHEFFKRYNPVGLNTIRVYVYQSVKDDRYHVLNMALRMGKGGSLDNETSGGIHTLINPDGRLNSYAVDKYGTKFTVHPDTGYSFDDTIPDLDKMKKLVIKIGAQVYFSRIVGLDVCYDQEGRWRVIEVNTKGHTIRFSQYGGQPFFGEFTDEVIDYCKQNHWTLQ